MPGAISLIRDQYTTLHLPTPPPNITDSCYIVTGANTGLGYECTKHLLLMGVRRIILAVRTPSKGEAALATLRRETGRSAAGEVWELDLTSLDSVEAFSKRLANLDRLDALICNAGVIMSQYRAVEGHETTLQVNVVATMLLAFRAMPKLQESAKKVGIQPRLTIVSSDQAFSDNVKLCVEKIAGEGNVFEVLSEEQNFDAIATYPRTKLLEIYIVRELAGLLPLSSTGVIVNTVSPGLCYSELDRNQGFLMKIMVKVFRALLARSTEKGSRTLLQAGFAGANSHGKYCSECKIRE
ncbi:uncharacterized protein N0V89_002270 [Didymosphaeria variabile]|uniref:NAD(P)-binding protein n=1 Tax=Didymosphaeria variabile TaxID=1932322 RepID=A0A9W8XSD0_9PLEO|nr:uncharacterized protein N0V89_002270 [Didymosphaeria variabile]KAJ4357694.1 hypothetical protein N0V89_002270 [Didymosphaeria variabile]